MDIYPARELPIPGVDADMVFKDVTSKSKFRVTKNNLMQVLEQNDIEVLATVGAGDIDTFVEPIQKMLKKKYEV
jgi:UDP-N-acetylmuramate--alanine ligase